MDRIKNLIQKSRSSCLEHGMKMRKERISKKMLHTKMVGKCPRGRPRTRWIDQNRKDIEMRGGNWEEI